METKRKRGRQPFPVKPVPFNCSLLPAEDELLERLAAEMGRKKTDVVREGIKLVAISHERRKKNSLRSIDTVIDAQ